MQEVERKFGKFGDVKTARIVRNPYNGESRGFGFVEMADDRGTDDVSPAPLVTILFQIWRLPNSMQLSLLACVSKGGNAIRCHNQSLIKQFCI